MNIENIREICTRFPGVTEDIKWGNDLVFSVGGKMFSVASLNQLPVSASFKVTDEEFDDMCSREGVIPAPYVAKYKWVLVEDIKRINKKEWQHFLKQSYDLVFDKLPAKTKKEICL